MALAVRLSEPQALAVGPIFGSFFGPFSPKLALSVHHVSALSASRGLGVFAAIL